MTHQYRIEENDADFIILQTIKRAISEDADRLVEFMEKIVPEGTKVEYDPDTCQVIVESDLPAHDIFPTDLAKYVKEELR
jgi:hypothetical protein